MIRFFPILILFLISLLCIFKAPEYHLWLLAIVVTEFPLLFIGVTALLTASGFWVQRYQLAGTILGLATLGIFLSPIFRAYWVSKNIKQDMIYSLGGIYTDSSPVISYGLSIEDLFKRTKDIPYQTLTYVKYADTSMSLDLYPSQIAGNKPCIIVVHGGSWAGGDSRQLPELNGYLAAKGYNVASINYRLAPKYQTPAPVKDVEAAMAYLKKHADELHIDTNNFVLLGRSAGAQIALLGAYTMHDPALKGVIDFYGPADMVWGYSVPSSPWIMDSRKVMENYIGGAYSQVPKKYAACSPLEFVDKRSVPTLIIHGDNDVLVSPEHSRRLNLKLQQNGIKHYLLKLPWATHGFDYNLNGPGGQLSTYAVEFFLNTVTKAR
ncbi:alpha/beta hydrolase [Mucilaginibacter sp.]|uniref:alpha/beta hydrolase n=1 Tax=Mucilaginibacter sp. TaxID=1882438 RepID=UPI0026096675|nr:alpha/beta hydrolase [Mucilaginibacter sp.]MDB4921931.1 lip2 [Mucilaginibacter sp.]